MLGVVPRLPSLRPPQVVKRSGSERVGLGWPASGDGNRTAASITPPIKLCYALVTLGRTGAPGFGRAHIEDDWGRGMNYPRRREPDFGEIGRARVGKEG